MRRSLGRADWVLVTASAVVIALLLGGAFLMFVVVSTAGAPRLSWNFLTSVPSADLAGGGIGPAIFGTVLLTLSMTLAVVPVGVATGIYLSEYASEPSLLSRSVRAAVQSLAGVPAIVFGLFGLGFFILFLGRGLDMTLGSSGGRSSWGQPSLLWSAMTLAVLTMPVVIVTTEEALRAVPRELRLAAMSLGATRVQTLWRVLLPNAAGGILTGAILAVSRGAGEVAPIMFTGAASFLPRLPSDARDMFMHLSHHVFTLATQSPDIDATRPALFASVTVLLVLTFSLNAVAFVLRARARHRLRDS